MTWLFLRCIRPFLEFLDGCIGQGISLDTKNELGFRRNSKIKIDNPQYWSIGHEFIVDQRYFNIDENLLPKFMHFLLSYAFKISRHMEMINMLECTDQDCQIYQDFVTSMLKLCPYLGKTKIDKTENSVKPSSQKLLLEINFDKIFEDNSPKAQDSKQKLLSIEEILEEYLNGNNAASYCILELNIEKQIESILNDSLSEHVNWCSRVLIEKLFNKYHIDKFFDFLHSFYLFKSSDAMFIFSKSLFELIKSYEIYQDDDVLNNLLYQANSSVFTTTALMQKCPFKSDLVTIHYGNKFISVGKEACLQLNQNVFSSQTAPGESIPQFKNTINSSNRLINSLSLNVKTVWPLTIIFKPENFDSYNKIFLFIMQLKQAKYDLDSLSLKGEFNLSY